MPVHVISARVSAVAARIISDYEAYLFGEGHWRSAWEKMGARPAEVDGVRGYTFVVWAPNAHLVSVVGNFNGWNGAAHPMRSLGQSGLWETFQPGLGEGEPYKFEILPNGWPEPVQKLDPFGLCCEVPPKTASITSAIGRYHWRDDAWMTRRREAGTALGRPMAAYEVHAGSWRRHPGEPGLLS